MEFSGFSKALEARVDSTLEARGDGEAGELSGKKPSASESSDR